MKKNYYLLIFFILLFAITVSYAQMQGINTSSERLTQSIETLGEFVKVENIDDRSILTLSRDINSNYSTFIKTKKDTNYIEIGHPINVNFEIYDFKIFNDSVYFCGRFGGIGFIAWIRLEYIFNSGIFYYSLLNPITVVYNLEVFKTSNNGAPKVVALGYNTNNQMYSFIDYNVWSNTSTYDVYNTSFKLQNLTQTDKYIAVVSSLPFTPYMDFGITVHDKTNIPNRRNRMFRFDNNGIATGDIFGRLPEANEPSYLIEWIEKSPNVMVATCIDQVKSPHFGSSSYPIALFNINLDSLSLYSTQVIPNCGKPYVKDMAYMPYDSTMHLIVNGQFGNTFSTVPSNDWAYTDFIHKIEVWNTSNYNSEMLLPSGNTNREDVLNSITKYDRCFYIVGGRWSTNNELYWFDRKSDVLGWYCYKKYTTIVRFDNTQQIGGVMYTPTTRAKNVSLSTISSYSDMYIKICSD